MVHLAGGEGEKFKGISIHYVDCSLPIRLLLLERLVELRHSPISSFGFKVGNGFVDGVPSIFIGADSGDEEVEISPNLSSLQQVFQYPVHHSETKENSPGCRLEGAMLLCDPCNFPTAHR